MDRETEEDGETEDRGRRTEDGGQRIKERQGDGGQGDRGGRRDGGQRTKDRGRRTEDRETERQRDGGQRDGGQRDGGQRGGGQRDGGQRDGGQRDGGRREERGGRRKEHDVSGRNIRMPALTDNITATKKGVRIIRTPTAISLDGLPRRKTTASPSEPSTRPDRRYRQVWSSRPKR